MWKAIFVWVVVASAFVAALVWAASAAPGFVRVTGVHLAGAGVFIVSGVVLIVNSHRQKRVK
ncbi:MAG: hypothetical protein O3B65_00085 [Chloroflexi bacterium]|nr:hypothetical protein [Chloroflexota bacterium]